MNKCTSIICEIASAHEGSASILKEMLRKADYADSDWVKIQIFQYKELVAKDNEKFSVLKKIELKPNEWLQIVRYAGKLKPKLIVEVFDLLSLDLVSSEPSVQAYKIPTSDLGDWGFVNKVCQLGKPVFIGVGGATIDEIDAIVQQVSTFPDVELTLLHGIQSFPTRLEDSLLSKIQLLKFRYDCNIGFADHVNADETELSRVLPAMAIASGASVIEKHMTLDRKEKGLDYYSALNPHEFVNFVEFVQKICKAIGKGELTKLTYAETEYRNTMKKFAVLLSSVKKGDELDDTKIAYRRTISPGITRAKMKKFKDRVYKYDFSIGAILSEKSFE